MAYLTAFACSTTLGRSLFSSGRLVCPTQQSITVPKPHRNIRKMSAPAVSAPPGQITKESQPARNPITSASTVLVVGASQGLGLEFVVQSAVKGAKVFATSRDIEKLPPGLKSVCSKYENVTPIKLDVTNVGDSLKVVSGAKITHVIHNAGVFGRGGGIGSATEKDMLEVFHVNAVGVLNVANALVPFLKKVNGQLPVYGVLTSKVGSIDDNGSGGMYAYRASKSACNNIVKSMSIDLAGRVSFVLLHPGYVRTRMTGGAGFIDVDESVAGMLRAVEATDRTVGFRWVDYKAELIPW